jgi:hypothetical protein
MKNIYNSYDLIIKIHTHYDGMIYGGIHNKKGEYITSTAHHITKEDMIMEAEKIVGNLCNNKNT